MPVRPRAGGRARETGGPILELGCGAGRVLLPIAREGMDCVGLDASPAMLAALRAKLRWLDVDLVATVLTAPGFARRNDAECLVGRQGLEPWTYGLKARSSTD